MRICGLAVEGLRNERPILEAFPQKELEHYWSSRPIYEDANSKSKEFMSGSSASAESGNTASGVDPGGGQTYAEWLALQKEEKDEVPPPPYTLEDDDDQSPDPIPSQPVTNANTRAAVVATAQEVPSVVVQNAAVVANAQPVASSSYAVASPPAVNISTRPSSAVSASQAQAYPQVSSHLVASPPAVNISARPTAAAPASQALQVSAQSSQPYPPSRGHSPQLYPPPGGMHRPQSRPPSGGHSPQSYSPSGASQHPLQSHSPTPAQSYHPQSVTPQGQLHLVTSHSDLPSGTPHSHNQLPQGQFPPAHSPKRVQHPQSYSPAGGSSYQGYATTGHSHGYPPAGAPSQGYNAQSAQSYPSSGDPVRQGYPPADGSSLQSYHNQSQDPATILANEFGRQNISGPSGGGGSGRLPTPPPLHPTHPGNSGYHVSRPPRPSTAGHARPPSRTQNRPAAASPSPSNTPLSSPPVRASSSAQNRPRWPPAEWDLDAPPVQKFSTHPERRPSSGLDGANLTRPQTLSASSYKPTGGSALRPTSSLSNRPPSRPNTASNTNTPPGHYSPPVTESAYNNVGNAHDHSNNYGSSSYVSTGPLMHGQHGSPIGFPTGPQYNVQSSYPGQQGTSTYNSTVQGSSYTSTPVPTISWPGPVSGHVSPPDSPPIAFPGSQLSYNSPGPSYDSGVGGSHYLGGPSFPSSSSSYGGGVSFPQAPPGGDGGYFGSNMPSSTFPNQGYGSGSPSGFPSSSPSYPQSSSAPLESTGPHRK